MNLRLHKYMTLDIREVDDLPGRGWDNTEVFG